MGELQLKDKKFAGSFCFVMVTIVVLLAAAVSLFCENSGTEEK